MIKINRNNINVVTIPLKPMYIIKINSDIILLKSKYLITHLINNNSLLYMSCYLFIFSHIIRILQILYMLNK